MEVGDPPGSEAVADGLKPLGLVAGGEPVGQGRT